MKFRIIVVYFMLIQAWVFPAAAVSQVVDTISNWDGIDPGWTVVAGGGGVVANPAPGGINPSGNCFFMETSDGPYDFMFIDFPEPVNFGEFYTYRVKVLAPETGGSVVMKFENSDNTSWVEIEKTPVPGQWDDLEYDFSGTTNTDFVRMVVFCDFLGNVAGNDWYVDDVLRSTGEPIELTSNLPIVVINTNGIQIPDEPKIEGTMGIIDNGNGNLNNQYDPPNDYFGSIGIEIRGQSSQMFPKKSYGFETRDSSGANLNVSLLGMPAENDWILYAPYSDKSMLRNFMSFYMGSKLDGYCTRMAYCEVLVNNDYKGVYILMEKIKRDANRVDIATLNPEDTSGVELTGGYMVKVDKLDPDFTYGTDGWMSIPNPTYPNAMYITFQYYYPKADVLAPQQRDYIKNYITEAENALVGSYFQDPETGYNKYLDPASFVDQMILCEVSKEVDKYRYSTYFYKEKNTNGGKLFAGPAWDFNLGYSNVDYWSPGNQYSGWLYPLVEPVPWSIMFWWKRLMEDSYFQDLFATRWIQLRENELSNDALEFAIDSVVGYIYEAQERNYERWPILGEYVWPNYDWQGNDYDDEVEYFETWFYNRLSWIDNNLVGDPLYPVAELNGTYPVLTVSLNDDYFNTPYLKKSDFTLLDVPPEINLDSVSYVSADQALVYVSGYTGTPFEVVVGISRDALNGFEDLTTGSVMVNSSSASQIHPDLTFIGMDDELKLVCKQPGLLGEKLEIFSLDGRRVRTLQLEPVTINQVRVESTQGIILCRVRYAGRILTQKVFVGR